MAHYHPDAVAPTFGQAHADDFEFGREIAQEDVGGGMKAQSRSDEIDEWRSGLQLHAGKISITREVTLFEMAPDTEPIVGCLEWKMEILAGFQFEDGEAASARDAEQVEDAVFAAGVGENLCVNKARIERGVDARDIRSNQGFEPAFGLRAIQRMASVAGERVPMNFQAVKQALECRA